MENIERTQFVVLTGDLSDHPLPDLIRRLRVQRKSGRLLVEYPDGPGAFFFEDGQLVDAQLGSFRGVEAVYTALSLSGASFNFNPLVRPPERNIDGQGQKFVRDLIDAPVLEGLAEIKGTGAVLDPTAAAAAQPRAASLQLPPAAELIAPLEERLSAVEGAIISTSYRFSRERLLYAIIIGFLAGLSLITTLNVIFGSSRAETAATGKPSTKQAVESIKEDAVSPVSEHDTSPKATDSDAKPDSPSEQSQPPVPVTAAVIGTRKETDVPAARREYVVQVLVEVKDGKVTDARVWNPRPGAGAYEAVALKMAMERRYPDGFNGGERLKISVKP